MHQQYMATYHFPTTDLEPSIGTIILPLMHDWQKALWKSIQPVYQLTLAIGGQYSVCVQTVQTVMVLLRPWIICNSCNMGARDLPDMYARGLRAYISGESRAPMLQVLCITFGTLKICLTYRFCFAYLYNNEYSFWLWFFYLTFRWRLFIPCIVVFLYNTVFTWKLALRNRDKWWV